MRSLAEPLRKNKQIRAIGFDDAPFVKAVDKHVNLSGVVCSATRFEGMLWGEVERDGLDATQVVIEMLQRSKFLEQLNLILADGITVAGFNFINLPELANAVEIPCIAVMRHLPDMEAFLEAMKRVDRQDQRLEIIAKAGEINSLNGFHFQVSGCDPDHAATALQRLTDKGNVPEPLRLAHLIGAAVKMGESSKRA